MKLTKARLMALKRIADENEKGCSANKVSAKANGVVLQPSVDAALITSARPFSYAFHTLHITDAGRAALAALDGGG